MNSQGLAERRTGQNASLVQFAGLLVGGSFRCLLPRRVSSRAASCVTLSQTRRVCYASHNTHSFTDAVLSSLPFMPAILSAVRPPFLWTSIEVALSSVKSSEHAFLSDGMVLMQRKSNTGHTRSRRFRISLCIDGMGQDVSLLWSPFGSTEPSAIPQAKCPPTTRTASRISGDSTYRARKCSCKSLNSFLTAQTHSCIPFVHQAQEVSELDLRALSLNAETLQLAAKNDRNVIEEIGRCLWEIFLSAERLASPEIDKLIRDNHFRCNLILLGIDEAHLLVPY